MTNPRQPLSHRVVGAGVELTGSIDETAKLLDLISHARGGRLVLDCAGVTFISSYGVREWIGMQNAARDAGVRIELRRVAEVLVHQLNIVTSTRGVSIVSSFYAPYECAPCEYEHQALIDVTAHGAALARRKPPAVACPSCGKPMTFSDPPDLYLSFLG
jgi:anti-anti-sigma regulatory factor